MRPGHRYGFGRVGAIRLVHLVSSEAGKLVTDFDDVVLVWLKEETNVAVVDDWDVLVFGGLFWGEMEVCVHPRLVTMSARGKCVATPHAFTYFGAALVFQVD